MGVTVVASYVFQVLMARSLSTLQYGELSSIVAALNIVTIPIFGLTMAITRDVAAASDSGTEQLWALVRPHVMRVVVITVAVIAGLLVLSPWLVTFLQVSSLAPLVFLAVLVTLTNAVGIGRAVLLGQHDFPSVALNQVVDGVVRLGSAIVIVAYGVIENAGFLGYAFGLVSALFLVASRIPARASVGTPKPAPHRAREQDISWASIVLAGTFIVLLNSDLVVVKHYLSPEQAGQYAAVSTLAKGLYVITSAFDVVLFPAVSAARAARIDGSAHLRRALLTIGLIVVPILGVYWIFAVPLVSLFFGARYVMVAPLLAPAGLAVTLLGLATLLARYGVAVGRGVPSAALLALAAATVAAFFLFHDSLEQVVGVLLITGVVTLGVAVSGTFSRG
jgi:O-antigen/teichoic acid export membrane protein